MKSLTLFILRFLQTLQRSNIFVTPILHHYHVSSHLILLAFLFLLFWIWHWPNNFRHLSCDHSSCVTYTKFIVCLYSNSILFFLNFGLLLFFATFSVYLLVNTKAWIKEYESRSLICWLLDQFHDSLV